MSPNDADGMANSVDPDQTDLGLQGLPHTYLSKNLGSLRYQGQKKPFQNSQTWSILSKLYLVYLLSIFPNKFCPSQS